MKKLTLALALVAASSPVLAAEAAKPAGLAPKVVPIVVTIVAVGAAIAAANNGGSSSGTSGTVAP